jgi:hypothetical protein
MTNIGVYQWRRKSQEFKVNVQKGKIVEKWVNRSQGEAFARTCEQKNHYFYIGASGEYDTHLPYKTVSKGNIICLKTSIKNVAKMKTQNTRKTEEDLLNLFSTSPYCLNSQKKSSFGPYSGYVYIAAYSSHIVVSRHEFPKVKNEVNELAPKNKNFEKKNEVMIENQIKVKKEDDEKKILGKRNRDQSNEKTVDEIEQPKKRRKINFEDLLSEAKKLPIGPESLFTHHGNFDSLTQLDKIFIFNLEKYNQKRDDWEKRGLIKKGDWIVVNTQLKTPIVFEDSFEAHLQSEDGDLVICVGFEKQSENLPGMDIFLEDDEDEHAADEEIEIEL